MGYTYRDAEQNSWAGPSINGLRELKAAIANVQDIKHPALDQLLEHGMTNMLLALSTECIMLARKVDGHSVENTLTHLAVIARKADEVVILEH